MTRPLAHRTTTTPERWQRVQDVLAAAIDIGTVDRGRFLEHHCAGDSDLRAEIESLLAAHDDDGPLDRLADIVAPLTSLARGEAAGWQGCRVAQYVVLNLIGAGGMGLVYKARDERLERHVALKFLSPHLSSHPAAKQRFFVEARAAAALDHPNVCSVYEIGETPEGHLFLAMPLYEGETLEARLTRGRLPFAQAAPIAVQIARGLGRAHEIGIVHRDVKPANVMLLTDGTAKILDFGIAQRDDLSPADGGVPVGTIAYMSPEHVGGHAVDHRADIWSLGVVLHEMLTGARPSGGDDRNGIGGAILSCMPAPIAAVHADVPPGLDRIVRRALAKRPEHRYPSMAAFAADLAALVPPGQLGAGAHPHTEPSGWGRTCPALVSPHGDRSRLSAAGPNSRRAARAPRGHRAVPPRSSSGTARAMAATARRGVAQARGEGADNAAPHRSRSIPGATLITSIEYVVDDDQRPDVCSRTASSSRVENPNGPGALL